MGFFLRLDFRCVIVVCRKVRLRGNLAAAGGNHVLRGNRTRQKPARHAACRGRVEAAGGEKLPRRAFGDNRAVKEHRAAAGVAGAELGVVADHNHTHAARAKAPDNPGEHALEFRVESLRRLVEQKHLGLAQQHLAQRCTLLLAAGKIVGMTLQQLRQLAEPRLFKRQRLAPVSWCIIQHGKKVLNDRIFDKQCLRVLRQQGNFARHLLRRGSQHGNLAAVSAVDAGNQTHGRGFSGAVAAEDCKKLARVGAQRQRFDNVGRLLIVPEKRLVQLDRRRSFAFFRRRGRRKRAERVRLGKCLQPLPALRDCDRAGKIVWNARVNAHWNGHGGKHVAACRFQAASHLACRAGVENVPALEKDDVGRQRQRVFEPMLRQDDCCAQLAVDPPERR